MIELLKNTGHLVLTFPYNENNYINNVSVIFSYNGTVYNTTESIFAGSKVFDSLVQVPAKDGTYNVLLSEKVAKISVKKIQALDHFEEITGLKATTSGSGKIEILSDTRGVSVITQIDITLPFITDQYYFTQIRINILK